QLGVGEARDLAEQALEVAGLGPIAPRRLAHPDRAAGVDDADLRARRHRAQARTKNAQCHRPAGGAVGYPAGVHSGSQPGSSSGATSLDETLDSSGEVRSGARPRAPAIGSFERGELVGRYVILDDIGRGAMGLVVTA